MTSALTAPLRPIASGRGEAVAAGIGELDGRLVACFRLAGGPHRGAIGVAEGDVVERLVRAAVDAGVPIVGVLATAGADVREGVAALHAWGRIARALQAASGVVPVLLAVTGPCVSGPALLLGMADVVVLSEEAFAYVSGPDAVRAFTGVGVGRGELGGPAPHATRSGLAAEVVADEDEALWLLADVLHYLPSNNLEEPPVTAGADPTDRPTDRAAAAVPASPTASYDVREVVADVVDADSLLELRPRWAASVVTALARIGGRPVGVIANQPSQLAGTLDIESSQKAARFVQWCDAFGLALVTFVDTPGFQPGKDIEWRGMIRHGAELVHAYAAATVPRVCVVLRKAYGGAYIVMDSKNLGNDTCLAWRGAELAVMGASGAVTILHGKRLAGLPEDEVAAARRALEADYADRHVNADAAARRGFVDAVIDPADTRRAVAGALRSLRAKREHSVRRRHSNTPL